MKRWGMVLIAGLAAWAATGLFIVQPDEVVLVRRCGKLLPDLRGPGAQLGFPWGIDRLERVRPGEVKRVSIGAASLGGESSGLAHTQFLTGDRNLVNARATVQYTIAMPADYVRQRHRADELVADAAEASLARILANQPIDLVLTQGKTEVALLARDALQSLLDQYGLGIAVRSVDLASLEPPAEVAPAFADVIAAQREREQSVNQAESYASQTLALAQADAQRIVDRARSERDVKTREALGEAERFEKLLVEYRRAPTLTARRLYWESMTELLPKLRAKLLIDRGQKLDLSIFGEEPSKP